MIRSSIGNAEFWQKWTEFSRESIKRDLDLLQRPSQNPVYEPQFVWDIAIEYRRLMLRRYSRGDHVSELGQYFPGLLDAWELSNRLADEVCRTHNLKTCRDWTFKLSNLNHYNWCFCLVGLALSLEMPEMQWRRLVALIGGEGEDELLDRVIASREPGRRIGSALLHPKPYMRLLKAIDAPHDQQAILLREFVDHWYPELERKGKERLWWYDFGDPVRHPLEKGSYFGRWCIEAVAAVKAFGIDDSLCLDSPYYPGDLVQDGRSPRYAEPALPPPPDMEAVEFGQGHKPLFGDWLSRMLFGSKKH